MNVGGGASCSSSLLYSAKVCIKYNINGLILRSIAQKVISFYPIFSFSGHTFVSLETKNFEQMKRKRVDLKIYDIAKNAVAMAF